MLWSLENLKRTIVWLCTLVCVYVYVYVYVPCVCLRVFFQSAFSFNSRQGRFFFSFS